MLQQRQEILKRLESHLLQEFGKEGPIGESAHIHADLGLDSFELLNLVTTIENEYEINLHEDPEHPPQTLGQVTDLILVALENKQDVLNE